MEVCKKLGITTKSLRIYEEKGLVVPKRDKNEYRNYSDLDLLRLRELLLLKDLGFSLQEIKKLLDKNAEDKHVFIRSLYIQRQAIQKKIQGLKNIEKTIIDSMSSLLNDNEDKQIYFDTMEEVLKENKKNICNWTDQWSFDTWANNYDSSLHDNNDDLNLFQDYDMVLEEVRKEIESADPEKILDLGCGTGNLSGLYSDRLTVYGIDQSLEMLLQCKSKYSKMKLRLGNFLDSTYIEGMKFDSIATTYAFHHLTQEEKEQSIEFMLHALNPNGRIIIGDLMFWNEEKREEKKQEFVKRGNEHLWEIVEDEFYGDVEKLKNYVEGKGLKFRYKHLVHLTWLIVIEK